MIHWEADFSGGRKGGASATVFSSQITVINHSMAKCVVTTYTSWQLRQGDVVAAIMKSSCRDTSPSLLLSIE